MATMNYCDKDADPSLTFANTAPPPRQELWTHREVMRLVQRAWRENKKGLAAAIAVMWDTMLSPIDARKLTAGQKAYDKAHAIFFLDRARQGALPPGRSRDTRRRSSKRTSQGSASICSTARPSSARREAKRAEGRPAVGAQAYTKDHLEKDFAEIRALVFGPESGASSLIFGARVTSRAGPVAHLLPTHRARWPTPFRYRTAWTRLITR